MVTGTSLTSSRDALRLSRLYPGVLYATTGKDKLITYISMNNFRNMKRYFHKMKNIKIKFREIDSFQFDEFIEDSAAARFYQI